jgi:RNA 2',3'-cyclic 3'-phosphodiesterase
LNGSALENVTIALLLMRLFVALDLDDAIRARIARFLEGVSGFVPEARWVRAESLHATLKFIGEKSEEDAAKIEASLQSIRAGTIDVAIRGYGFFPNARSPRVFWIGVEAGEKLGALASTVDETLAPLGVPREEHAFNAHITLARAGSARGGKKRRDKNPVHIFQRLQEKLASLPAPEFGSMTAREFFLYQSRLSPAGSKYTKLARFTLGPV